MAFARVRDLAAWPVPGNARGIACALFLLGCSQAPGTDRGDSRHDGTYETATEHLAPPLWSEQAKLNFGRDGGYFGVVSLVGNTALIGSWGADVTYVFDRTATTWSRVQTLEPVGGGTGRFGWSVSVSGDTVLIGASEEDAVGTDSGAAYVFVRSGASWAFQQKLTASDAASSDNFGYSVSLSGDIALVGAIKNDVAQADSGSAYVFVRNGTSWSEQQRLSASDSNRNQYFGWSVAVSGDTALIGAPQDDDIDINSGAAYVFVRSGSSWSLQRKLIASDGSGVARVGECVSLSGETALVGAPGASARGTQSGAAYVFVRSGSTWSQLPRLAASDGTMGDNFGSSVAISGGTAIIGAYHDNPRGRFSGSAYVFARSGTAWTQQQKLSASEGSDEDEFGSYVAISSDTALVGAPLDDPVGLTSGSAYVFALTNGSGGAGGASGNGGTGAGGDVTGGAGSGATAGSTDGGASAGGSGATAGTGNGRGGSGAVGGSAGADSGGESGAAGEGESGESNGGRDGGGRSGAGPTAGIAGDAGSDGTGEAGADHGSSNDDDEQEHAACGCRSVGRSQSNRASLLLFTVLGLAAWRRASVSKASRRA